MKEVLNRLSGAKKSKRSLILWVLLGVIIVLLILPFLFGPKPFPWMDGDSPLGVLLEDGSYSFYGDIKYDVVYLSGVPESPYRSPEGLWVLPINFGKHPTTGEKMVLTWFFGPDANPNLITRTEGDRVIFDPTLEEPPVHEYVQITAKELLEGLDIGYMYPMELVVGANNYASFDCIDEGDANAEDCQDLADATERALRANAAAVAYIKGETEVAPEENTLTWVPSFHDISKEGTFDGIGEILIPRVEAQVIGPVNWTHQGYLYDKRVFDPFLDRDRTETIEVKTDGEPLTAVNTGVACTYGAKTEVSPLQVYTGFRLVNAPQDSTCSYYSVPGTLITGSFTSKAKVWLSSTAYNLCLRYAAYYGGTCSRYYWKDVTTTYTYRQGTLRASCSDGNIRPGIEEVACIGTAGSCAASYEYTTCRIQRTYLSGGGYNEGCRISNVRVPVSCGSPPRASGPPPPVLPPPVVPPVVPPPGTPQCSDGVDNDGDALIDANDPGCHTDGDETNPATYDPTDNDETDSISPPPPTTQCSDGIDNDSDGDIDAADPGCNGGGTYDPTDDDENEPSPVVWIDATPKVVTSGGVSLLDWGVTNLGDITSITCTSDSDPDQSDWQDNATTTTSGPRTVEPTSIGITTYSITCTNSESETGSDSVTVIVPFIQEVLP